MSRYKLCVAAAHVASMKSAIHSGCVAASTGASEPGSAASSVPHIVIGLTTVPVEIVTRWMVSPAAPAGVATASLLPEVAPRAAMKVPSTWIT
eukprot:1406631-Prymnesium_polylepis.3